MVYLLVSVLVMLTSYTDALPAEPFIIYSNITNIHALDLNTMARTNVLGGLDRAIPLGVDTVNNHIYFGEHTLGLIYRSNYDGSSKTLIMEDVKYVEGVTIDWIGRKLYWTAYKSKTIEVATLDGKYRKVLLYAGLEYPRGMAVDPIAGYLFWSDWGAAAAIERCSLDGTDRVALVKDNITWPHGVTLDTNQELVYWIESYHDTISSMDYSGNKRRVIFDDTSLALSKFHGFDLDISEDSIYFTEWLANAIYEVDISSGVIVRNISVPTTNYIKGAMGLRVIDSSKQQAGTSNCGNNNGGCEQLCFHKVPTGTSCGCQLGMKLTSDNKSCEDAFEAGFIMFADADAGKIYQMQLDSMNVKPIAVPFDENTTISRPVALEYDRVEDRVYWSDVTLNIICRAFRNGTGFEVLFRGIGVADGLTIDHAGRQLYWTSTSDDTIEISKLDGSYRKTLVSLNLDEPRDIIVDPIDGYMYWTDWGRFPRIERAYMNGENRMDLVNHTLRWPNGLTIDHVYNKLYWADAGEDNIEVMDLATLERKVVLNKKIRIFGWLFSLTTQVNHPYGLTLLDDHIYWTDWYTDAVYRAGVNSGANIVLMVGNLGKPMDIHAYSAIQKQQQKLHYTFSFPQSGSNFTCIRSISCPPINSPPQCPPGYNEVRENSTCGLYCRDIVGYTWRCPCNDWMSCAVKQRYLWGCASGYYSSFRVRECAQVVRPGRCPTSGSRGSQQLCNSDPECPNDEKCCNSKCATVVTIDTHPCRINNGGCDQLCFGIPGGRKCGCENGTDYDETLSKCLTDTSPTSTPPTTPPGKTCKVPSAPGNGSVNCDANPVPHFGDCHFTCDQGYELVGYSRNICVNGKWIDDTPTCITRTKPTFSYCPNDTTVPTSPGKSYATVNWAVPTAADKDGVNLKVNIWPTGYGPPTKLNIGLHSVRLTTSDRYGIYAYCYFHIIVEDREPPTFGSSCPNNVTLYTDNEHSARLPSSVKKPVATDNAKPPNLYIQGYPHGSYFPIGITVVNYTAVDAAGLSASCVFSVTVVNVCRGVMCTHGAKCVLDTTTGNSHTCACSAICPQLYDPVCGSDGQTYDNECLMNVTRCFSHTNITVVIKGECGDCSTVQCGYRATCKVIRGVAKCECDFTCTDSKSLVCGSDLHTYDNECKMREAGCNAKRNITVLVRAKCGDCSTVQCGYRATCKVIRGVAKCECDFTCTDSKSLVCGSDLQTYDNECKMREAGCNAKRNITVLVREKCGCDDLNLSSEDFKTTSEMACQNVTNSVKCEVGCQVGYNAVFPNFLKIQCYNNKWIRKNNIGKYVRLANANAPPRCYEPTPKNALPPYCPSGSVLMGRDRCVACPPGSYYNRDEAACVPCAVTMYQEQSGKTYCKKCQSPKTSTITGAEDCYFDHSSNDVKMVLEKKRSGIQVTEDKIRKDIADGLTNVCKNTKCTFVDGTVSRKRRDVVSYKFQAAHVVVVSIQDVSNNVNTETEVEIFVLDPTSNSLLPDKAFSSETLKDVILKISDSDLPYTLKSVDGVKLPSKDNNKDGNKNNNKDGNKNDNKSDGGLKIPVVAGGIIGVVVLIGLVFAIYLYNRRRKNKRTAPSVQFSSAGGGRMQIGQLNPALSNSVYENPEEFRNGLHHDFVVYDDAHDPPPYYESSPFHKTSIYENPSPNFYEMPDERQAGRALPAKDNLPAGSAVVGMIPSKDVAHKNPAEADFTVMFAHNRTKSNVYEVPDTAGVQCSANPDAETELKLKPPPTFDDVKLQVMRENTYFAKCSSILPNVPRKKNVDRMDENANEAKGSEEASRSHNQNVRHFTT